MHESHIVKALIDNSTEKNFLSQKLVMKKEISVNVTRVSAHIIDSHFFVIYEWVVCEVLITDSEEILCCSNQSFLTADIASYNVILEWSWLEHANSVIDWQTAIWFYKTTEVLMLHEFWKKSAECQVYTVCVLQMLTLNNISKVQLASIQIDNIILSEEYNEYKKVFFKEGASQLTDEIKVSHAIDLEKDKKSLYKLIYSLSVKELWVLCEYLVSSTAKSWIQKSTSSASSSILFVKKQDSSLKLCVNYHELNKIIIKNYYLLPLINEILN